MAKGVPLTVEQAATVERELAGFTVVTKPVTVGKGATRQALHVLWPKPLNVGA
jgi:hypothetical protein